MISIVDTACKDAGIDKMKNGLVLYGIKTQDEYKILTSQIKKSKGSAFCGLLFDYFISESQEELDLDAKTIYFGKLLMTIDLVETLKIFNIKVDMFSGAKFKSLDLNDEETAFKLVFGTRNS